MVLEEFGITKEQKEKLENAPPKFKKGDVNGKKVEKPKLIDFVEISNEDIENRERKFKLSFKQTADETR